MEKLCWYKGVVSLDLDVFCKELKDQVPGSHRVT